MTASALRQSARITSLLSTGAHCTDASLSCRGWLAFYYYHLYKASGDNHYFKEAQQLLRGILDGQVHATPGAIDPSFGSGSAGLAYVLRFLAQEAFLDAKIDWERLDGHLFETACRQIETGEWGFLQGAMGIVYYFSECSQSGGPHRYLDELVERVCARAIQDEDGCWFGNGRSGGQEVDLSLSDGLCGILLVLVNAHGKTRHQPLIENIVREGTRFILRHKLDVDYANGDYSFFPVVVKRPSDEILSSNRLAWSYGDLNEVLLFYRAGALLNDGGLRQLADIIGAQSMMRKDEAATMVTDAYCREGAAGLAQYYKTLYTESGLAYYLDGYHYWMEQLLLLLEQEQAVDASVLYSYFNGLPGVGLVLLSGVSEKELTWSRSLLL